MMKLLAPLFFLFSLFFAHSTLAAVVHAPHVDAELISENQSIQPGQKFWVAVRLQLENHWHVYWENPGDSGLPTKFQWSLPKGFIASKVFWPVPSRIELPPLVNYGFEGDELFLFEVEAPGAIAENTKVPLEVNVSWLVCREECIPGKAKLVLELPVHTTPPAPNSWKIAFDGARDRIPKSLEVSAEISQDKVLLHLAKSFPNSKLEFFPLDEPFIAGLAEQEILLEKSGVTLQLQKSKVAETDLHSLRGILVSKGKNVTEVFSLSAPIKNTVVTTETSFGLELFFAFLGGLILNFMPCVFPVLSIKILAVTSGRKKAAAHLRKHGIFYALGVLCSFWTLALLLYAARASGQGLGWGFQLQSPAFVAALAMLFFLVALNFLGFLEVGNSFMGIGSELASREGSLGDFFTGVLAVVVASPCSAPFMGTAIGFALTAPFLENILIFTFLAFGLSLPYLLLSFSPEWLKLLPRPGAWMSRLKEFFAFPMFLTVIWLLWVFAQQSGLASTFILLLAFFFLGLMAWLFHALQGSILKNSFIVICVAIALLCGFYVAPEMRATQLSVSDSEWKPFSKNAVDEAIARGEPIFVDFTAAWCLTCQVNEKLVLSRRELRDLFRLKKVNLFRGDWTNKDPNITTALEQVGRAGVPVYLVYAPGKREPQILPQVLTVNNVTAALQP